MASHIDSHVKQIFASNPSLVINYFVFPEVKVPICDFSSLPVDADAYYVDFSFDQCLSHDAEVWSKVNRIRIFSLVEWLRLISKQSDDVAPIKLDTVNLAELQQISVSEELLTLIEPFSRKELKSVLSSWMDLDLRSLHYRDVQTPEGFFRETIANIAEQSDAANIQFYSYLADSIVIALAKTYFSLVEMHTLEIYSGTELIYSIAGRGKGGSSVAVIFAKASNLAQVYSNKLPTHWHLVITLDNGLLDLNAALTFLSQLNNRKILVKFKQISSRVMDSFLVCSFEQNRLLP